MIGGFGNDILLRLSGNDRGCIPYVSSAQVRNIRVKAHYRRRTGSCTAPHNALARALGDPWQVLLVAL